LFQKRIYFMDRMFSFKVREQDRQGWGNMAAITAGPWLCIPVFMVGGMLGEGLPPGGLVLCTVIGILIVLACMCFVGLQSCKSGLPATVMSAEGLGVLGVRFVPALLITITSIGWFGVQAAVCGASFSVMLAEILGISVPVWGTALFWGLVISVSAMQGYRIFGQFYYIAAPVLFLVVIYTVVHTLFFSEAGSAAALFAWRPVNPMLPVTAISLVMGTWAMGAFTIGAYCRYAKKKRDAVLGISVGLIIMPVMILGGAIFRIIAGNADITVILNRMGYPAMALVFLILSNWAINVLNAYCGGIALSVLLGFTEKRLNLSTALAGIMGTVLGAAGILSRFTDFLGLLSSFVPPLIGVLGGVKITNLLRYGRRAGDNSLPGKPIVEDGIPMKPGFHIPGIIAYALGVMTAWITASVVPFFIPPLNGIVTAAAIYVILDLVLGHREEQTYKVTY
jgi:cytosine permease